MPPELPALLRDLSDRQRGVITRGQALSAGLNQDKILSRLDSGRWQRLYPGVYAVFAGAPDREGTLWAAVLRAGQGAVLSHQSAAELDQLIDTPAPLIHVTIPASRRVDRVRGIVVHTRLDVEAATHPSRLPPRTRTEETTLDLADGSDNVWDAVGWVTSAIGRRLTTQDLLRATLSQRSRHRWRADLDQVLNPDLAGIHSVLEYRYVHNVERPHGLPPAHRQAPAKLGKAVVYRDALYEEYKVAIEFDGRIAHPGDTRWQDIHRDNATAVSGITTLRYGYRELTARSCLVAQEISDVLRHNGWPGSARPCSPACPIARPAPSPS